MAWDDDMPEILRVMINDMDDAPTYSDDKLLRVLLVAMFQVLTEMEFQQTYTISIANQTLSPDPTLTATREDSFTNLVSTKAACIIDRGSAIVAAQRAISVRDGGSSVDLRGVFQGKLALLEKGWCAVYEDMKEEYKLQKSSTVGAMVLTPFRLYAWGRGWGGRWNGGSDPIQRF